MASNKTHLTLEGMAELEKALLEISSKATQGNILKRCVSMCGADYADVASSMAPKGPTGRLAGGIRVSKAKIINPGQAAFAAAMREGATRAEAAAAARAANREAGGTGRSAVCSAGPVRWVFYGLFQEFGTRYHPPQPFMRPAWDQVGPSMPETMRVILAEEIEKTRKRMARRAERLAAQMEK